MTDRKPDIPDINKLVNWDNGSGLVVIYGIDLVRKVVD